jgi:integrase
MLQKKVTKELDFFLLFKKFINATKKGKRLQPNGKRVSSGTSKNYDSLQKLLKKFCADKKMMLRLKPVAKLNKRELRIEKNYWKNFYLKFTNYLGNDCNHFDNSIGLCIKNLRVFFNFLNKDLLLGIGDFHLQFYVRKEDISIVTLMPEELNFFIYNQHFNTGLSPRLKEVRDFFVFGCTVALRFSDLELLNKTNLRVVNNNVYLVVRSQKVGADTSIKLPDYAVEILQRYKLKGGKLLPHFNNSNLNKYLKILVELAGFIQPIGKRRDKLGRHTEVLKLNGLNKNGYRFCDLITTHTMRRTAITTMLCLGMPEMAVRKISGHSPMSKEFFRYVSLAQTYLDNETCKMFDKLKTSITENSLGLESN